MKNILSFIKETWKRFTTESPAYFKTIQIISAIVVFITGIPAFIAMYNITLPSPFDVLASKAVAIAAIIGYIISKLPVKDPSTLK